MLSFHVLRRIIEGKLYEYGASLKEQPSASVSAVYEGLSVHPKKAHHGTPVPEQWVLGREYLVKIGRVVNSLPETERKLVRLRYIEGKAWGAVERELNMHRSTAMELRDRVVSVVAVALGLIGRDAEDGRSTT